MKLGPLHQPPGGRRKKKHLPKYRKHKTFNNLSKSRDLREVLRSRDHRPDRPQIVIGVVTSKEGIPFAHYVFEGNKVDKTTVKEVVDDLKERFGITHCIFVGDRGMVTRINLETIKDHEYDYIMGIRRHNSRIVRELLPFIKEKPTDEILEIRQEQLKDKKLIKNFTTKTRFVIGFNEFVQQKVRKTRESKFSQFKAFLEELAVEGELDVVSKNMSKINAYLKQKKLKRYYCVSLQQKDDLINFVWCWMKNQILLKRKN